MYCVHSTLHSVLHLLCKVYTVHVSLCYTCYSRCTQYMSVCVTPVIQSVHSTCQFLLFKVYRLCFVFQNLKLDYDLQSERVSRLEKELEELSNTRRDDHEVSVLLCVYFRGVFLQVLMVDFDLNIFSTMHHFLCESFTVSHLLYPPTKVGDILVSRPFTHCTFSLVCAITQKRFHGFHANLAHTCIWVRRAILF